MTSGLWAAERRSLTIGLAATVTFVAAEALAVVTVMPLVDAPSNDFDSRLRERIARAAEDQGLSAMAILSAAGHDARHLAMVCPAAMIFVPCRDGASHVEHEWAEPEHLAAGASVLAQVMRDLAFANQRSVAEA